MHCIDGVIDVLTLCAVGVVVVSRGRMLDVVDDGGSIVLQVVLVRAVVPCKCVVLKVCVYGVMDTPR